MKLCSKCKKWKNEGDFNKNRSRKDGLSIWCIKCIYAYIQKRHSGNWTPSRYSKYKERHRIIDGIKQKRCTKCKQWKAESDFYKNRIRKDGSTFKCKKCINNYRNKHYGAIPKPLKRYPKFDERHRTIEGIKQKLCNKCNKWKNETQLYKNKYTPDGLKYQCRDCEQALKREYNKKMGKSLRNCYRYEECHRVVDGVKQKRCTKCKKWKVESDFYKKSRNRDGLNSCCKICSDKATKLSRKKRLALRNQ